MVQLSALNFNFLGLLDLGSLKKFLLHFLQMSSFSLKLISCKKIELVAQWFKVEKNSRLEITPCIIFPTRINRQARGDRMCIHKYEHGALTSRNNLLAQTHTSLKVRSFHT